MALLDEADGHRCCIASKRASQLLEVLTAQEAGWGHIANHTARGLDPARCEVEEYGVEVGVAEERTRERRSLVCRQAHASIGGVADDDVEPLGHRSTSHAVARLHDRGAGVALTAERGEQREVHEHLRHPRGERVDLEAADVGPHMLHDLFGRPPCATVRLDDT